MYQRRIKQNRRRGFTAVFALLVHLLAPTQANTQFQAMVKRITAETKDGIRVTAWTTQQTVGLKGNVRIYYEVENRSSKTIYLVRQKGELQTAITSEGTLSIMVPIPFPDDHGGYDFSFTRVERRKSYKGRLIFPASKLNEERKWSIDVAFGIVADIKGLNRRLRNNEDPAPLRGQLGKRILILGINGLVVDVEEP
jgi:hypothetical protein